MARKTSSKNPDGDALNNLLEYAFMGNPNANSQTEAPTYGLLGTAPRQSIHDPDISCAEILPLA